MLIEGRVIGRSVDVPSQAGLVTYTVTSVEGMNRATIADAYPLARALQPIDANDPLAYPDIRPAELNSACYLRRSNGALSLWQVQEAVHWGPCQT